MKDLKKIQEFFSKPLEENTFKKGDKVTYLGHPAVVTATKEYNGKNFVSVSYNKGKGKTKASDILATDGTVKSIDEAKVDYDFSERELIRVLRQLKRNASTEIDMIKAFTKALGRDITKDELFSESIDEAIGSKVEVVLSNQILDFLQQRNLITGVNAQKVHKDLTTFIKNIKINLNADLDEAIVLESVYTDPNTGKNYDLQYVSSKNRNLPGSWELDIMKKDSSIYDKITTIKRTHIDDIIDWLDGYNIDSSWVIPKVNESVNLKQAKLSSSEYQKAKKLKDFNKDDYKWDSKEDLYIKVIEESLNPEVTKAVSRFIKAMAKRYDYSERDAVFAIQAALKQRDFDGLNEDTRQDLRMSSSVSKRRAKAELKNPGNDGSKVYGLDKEGKRVHIKNINDVDKFTKFELDADLNESIVEKVIAQIKEEKPGLWANIRAKKARGGKPAHGNSDAHKTAVKAGKKINSLKEEEGVPHYTKDGKEWKGKLHKMPDGSLMSGNPHDKNGSGPNGKSEKLFHKEDLNEIEGKSLK